ncbi:uncharacterized protein JCM6883_006046 [Sporobolomyces salmoneus]|uniref:uncharacterized protein n=1 Tax=Sporobolomyces salmoneus TaxID=183962 RepID=UPI00317DD2AC
MTSSPPRPVSSSSSAVDLLLLGAGWTSTFLLPHLASSHPRLSVASTTRDGRNNSIRWTFDPSNAEDPEQYRGLPRAKTVVVTFPIKGEGGSQGLVRGYERAKGIENGEEVRWIQLGSTGIWDGGPTLIGEKIENLKKLKESSSAQAQAQDPPSYASSFKWTGRHSPYDKTNARAIAEDELLSLHRNTFVLNLSGLWGGERDPSNWIGRIASSKQALEIKGSLHLIHGLDVARAIVAVHLAPSIKAQESEKREDGLKGQRYLLTDLRVIDWWDLASRYPHKVAPRISEGGEETPESFKWVQELMKEHDVRALPRTPQELGRALDSREFWKEFGLMPVKGCYEKGRL